MNKDDAREAAISELHAKQFVEGRDLRFYGAGFDKGFDAGAASVDRRAIVEKAFNKLWSKLKIGVGSINGAETTKKAIDAILADMGGDDE